MGLGSILLVEDERINVMAFKKGLEKINAVNKLIIHETAESALTYLRDTEKLPSIIILDLNLPRMDGTDFIKITKKDPVLKRIPVIVITSSANPKDKLDCFNEQVAGYFVKPIDYMGLIESIVTYWRRSQLAEIVLV